LAGSLADWTGMRVEREHGLASRQAVVCSVCLVYLLCSSDAQGQTPPVYRGYVGALAGVAVLTAGDLGAPLDGTAPLLGGLAGATLKGRTSVEAEITWLRLSDPQSYRSIRSEDTVTQFQVDMLWRYSTAGPPYDVDFVGGFGILHRNYTGLITGSFTQNALNVQFGVDVTKWWNNVGVAFGLRSSIAPEARPSSPAPYRLHFLFSGGIRRRF
jgi:hypothetical protein